MLVGMTTDRRIVAFLSGEKTKRRNVRSGGEIGRRAATSIGDNCTRRCRAVDSTTPCRHRVAYDATGTGEQPWRMP